MIASATQRERIRRATAHLVRGPHHPNDDEDIHPPRLDEAEAELGRALDASTEG